MDNPTNTKRILITGSLYDTGDGPDNQILLPCQPEKSLLTEMRRTDKMTFVYHQTVHQPQNDDVPDST